MTGLFFLCPLDWVRSKFARWRYHFENGSAKDVLSVLTAYQNLDGGFGHGLEADALNPGSSPIQTWTATMVLREMNVFDPENPIVSGIIRYLTSGKDFDGHCWAKSVPGNNDYPHAPWWSWSPSANSYGYNPTASLAGYLLRVASAGSDAAILARRIATEAFDYAMSGADVSEMHLLPCFCTLCSDVQAVCPDLFDVKHLRDKLFCGAADCIVRDKDGWAAGYCAMPSYLISEKADPLYAAFPELAERECNFIRETQQPDGAWPVNWSWDAYPDAFAVSANHWKSWIVLKNLLYLKGMGKL